jgi:surface protein
MSFIFYNCYKLESLPDISKWNTENVINMSGLFGSKYNPDCKPKLKSIPDISKWNTSNVKYFGGCYKNTSSLSPLTNFEINKMNEKKESYIISGMFNNCESLSSLPDISKWNTNNAINMSHLFYFCSSLSSLPDISKWNTNNVNNMSYLFCFLSIGYLYKIPSSIFNRFIFVLTKLLSLFLFPIYQLEISGNTSKFEHSENSPLIFHILFVFHFEILGNDSKALQYPNI